MWVVFSVVGQAFYGQSSPTRNCVGSVSGWTFIGRGHTVGSFGKTGKRGVIKKKE